MAFTSETSGPLQQFVWTWTSSAGGAATYTPETKFSGSVVNLVTIPDGVSVPTTNYDVTVIDDNGVDVLNGAGIDRDSTLTQYAQEAALGVVANSQLDFTIANAGDTKKGTVVVTLR
jgi:hypothetical protein